MNNRITWQTVAAVVLAVLFLLSFIAIGELRDSIDSLRVQYVNEINGLRREIEAIYDNVDTKLKEQASLLMGTDHHLGKLDTATNTVEVSLTVVPKVYTDQMTARISFGGRTVEATQDGGGFTAILPVELFAGYDEYPLLTLTADGETKTEYLESVDLSYLHLEYLPVLMADASGGVKFSDGEASFPDELHVSAKPSSDDGAVTFVKYELAVEKNGEELDRVDITDKMVGWYCDIKLPGSYPAKEGDEIAVYAVAEDSLGYVHKALAEYWKEIDGAVAEVVEAGEHIYDRDGNLLN